MNRSRLTFVLLVLALLAGCTGRPAVTFDQSVEDLAKKIAADWKAVAGVADVRYEYRHGLDLGQSIGLDAALKPESASEAVVQELVEIAKRDYWQSTASAAIGAAIYRSEKLPDGPAEDKSIIMFNGPIKIDVYDQAQVDELTEKYGPRPTEK